MTKGSKGRSDCEIFLLVPQRWFSQQDRPRAEVGYPKKNGREGTERSARHSLIDLEFLFEMVFHLE
jgi:hypothetical protein